MNTGFVASAIPMLSVLAVLCAPATATAEDYGINSNPHGEFAGEYLDRWSNSDQRAARENTTPKSANDSGSQFDRTPITDRIVLAGGSLMIHAVKASKEFGGKWESQFDYCVNQVGPSIQYYPDPSLGFNVGLALGVAVASLESGDWSNLVGLGIGISASLGYDLWEDDQWSLGLSVRVTRGIVPEYALYNLATGLNAVSPGITITAK